MDSFNVWEWEFIIAMKAFIPLIVSYRILQTLWVVLYISQDVRMTKDPHHCTLVMALNAATLS